MTISQEEKQEKINRMSETIKDLDATILNSKASLFDLSRLIEANSRTFNEAIQNLNSLEDRRKKILDDLIVTSNQLPTQATLEETKEEEKA